jgi:hypothetical protein
VVDALVRGLERNPTARWPSMPALLAALAPAPRRRRWPIIVAGLVGAGVATTGALVFVMVDRDSPAPGVAPAPPQVLAPPAPPAGPPAVVANNAPAMQAAQSMPAGSGGPVSTTAPPVARESTTITLRLTVEPSAAKIMLDGAQVQGTELVFPRDAAAHLLRISAPGYREYKAFVAFNESQHVSVQLKRQKATTTPSPDNTPHEDPPTAGSNDLIDSDSPYQ